jgi:hypothetical protein
VQLVQLRIRDGDVLRVAGDELGLVVTDGGGADAVPLRLERPVIVVERFAHERREHRVERRLRIGGRSVVR